MVPCKAAKDQHEAIGPAFGRNSSLAVRTEQTRCLRNSARNGSHGDGAQAIALANVVQQQIGTGTRGYGRPLTSEVQGQADVLSENEVAMADERRIERRLELGCQVAIVGTHEIRHGAVRLRER